MTDPYFRPKFGGSSARDFKVMGFNLRGAFPQILAPPGDKTIYPVYHHGLWCISDAARERKIICFRLFGPYSFRTLIASK